jgi:hypothetical protein
MLFWKDFSKASILFCIYMSKQEKETRESEYFMYCVRGAGHDIPNYESLTGSRDLPAMSRSNSVAAISPSNLALFQ